jgi:hypothetical protein
MLRFMDDVQDRTKVAVNKPTVSRPQAVNSAVNKGRGSYPGTDTRRAYMRAYMAKRRAAVSR